MGEDEELTPWEPYHVDRGFDRNTSTVTAMMMMNMTYQLLTAGDTAEPHLTGLCYYMGKAFGSTFMEAGEENKSINVFISPGNARIIANGGYTKEQVKQYLAKHSTLTVGEIDEEMRFSHSYKHSVHSLAMEGRVPKEWDRGPNDRIPFVTGPNKIDIVVCSSAQRNRNLIMRSTYCTPVTKAIKLPARS